MRRGQYPRATTLLEESLLLRRSAGDLWGNAVTLGSLGWAALRQHNFKRMRELLGESLSIRLDSGDTGGSAWCLERLAEAAILAGQAAPFARRSDYFLRAARIFGAAAALRARLNAVIDLVDQPEFERQVAALRASLGEDVFSGAWVAGSAMTLEQAVDYAFAEPEGSTSEEDSPPEALARESFGGLTARERQVAALIAQGQSNRKIAEALVVSVKTVETYVTRTLGKLGFDSRVQIATWAVQKGLAPPGRD
jgi:DNA-binding CsgD family transcriptional regulator